MIYIIDIKFQFLPPKININNSISNKQIYKINLKLNAAKSKIISYN